jgi:hypothetical protein
MEDAAVQAQIKKKMARGVPKILLLEALCYLIILVYTILWLYQMVVRYVEATCALLAI